MMPVRRVNRTRAIIGNGRARLSTTWLMTSAVVASAPRPTTAKAGSIVTSRRTQIGIVKPTKPCVIIWPAIVPTTELGIPEAGSETRKAPAAAAPSSGVKV
jgi:hypothetical protein